MCQRPEFGHRIDQTVRAYVRRSTGKIWPVASRLSKLLEVIGTDMDRSATYDFLLVFIITMGLSRTVSEINGDFDQNSQNFPTPVHLMPTLREICNDDGTQKNYGDAPTRGSKNL